MNLSQVCVLDFIFVEHGTTHEFGNVEYFIPTLPPVTDEGMYSPNLSKHHELSQALLLIADIPAASVPQSFALLVPHIQLGTATLAYSQADDRSLPAALPGPHSTTSWHD